MSINRWIGAILALGISQGALAAESPEPIKVGGMCDRTGSTRLIGIEMCPGISDYMALVNKKGGVLGHQGNRISELFEE